MGAGYMTLVYIWLLLEVSAILISLFGNSVVIYVMSREKRLRKKSSLYIISIAVADLLTCVIHIPLIVNRKEVLQDLDSGKNNTESSAITCIWILSIAYFMTMTSVFQLFFVSLDRYWAICRPNFYLTRTVRFTKYVILSCWITGLVLGLIPLTWFKPGANCRQHKNIYITVASQSVACFIAIVVFYSLIYKALKRQVI